MKRTIRLVFVAGIAAVTTLSGCASLSGSGTSQEVSVRTLKDGVPVDGVPCTLKNDKASYEVTTPGKVVIHRAETPLKVECKPQSGTLATAFFDSSKVKTSVGHDIANGMLGAAIDRKTGAAFEYPANLDIELGKAALVRHQTAASN
jgi:outer membrane murein-binding lipoprotein Lpp